MHADHRPAPRSGGSSRWLLLSLTLAVAVCLPLILAGPGNDLDVANVFRAGRSVVMHADYVPSRAPGAPIHELLIGLADRFGGTTATNLISFAAAVVLVVALDRLLAGEGLGPGRRWAIAVIVANPWFLIAATSTVDFVPALAFVVLAALALRRGHPVWAGLAAGAAMGCRIGSALLIASMLLAEIAELADRHPKTTATPGEPSEDRTRPPRPALWRRALITGLVAAVTTLVLFVPSFVHAGGLTFAENDFRTASPLVHLGRTLVKDLMLLGPLAWLLVLATLPAVLLSLRRWRISWLVRFAVPALLSSQLLFLRFPWKMGHLLPSLMAGAVLLAVALSHRPRLLMALVGLQLLHGALAIEIVEPNRPNEATGGRLTLTIVHGPVLRDLRCRLDHPDPQRGRQRVEVEAAWNCAQPFARRRASPRTTDAAARTAGDRGARHRGGR